MRQKWETEANAKYFKCFCSKTKRKIVFLLDVIWLTELRIRAERTRHRDKKEKTHAASFSSSAFAHYFSFFLFVSLPSYIDYSHYLCFELMLRLSIDRHVRKTKQKQQQKMEAEASVPLLFECISIPVHSV